VALATCGRPLLTAVNERHRGIYPVYPKAGRDWLGGRRVYVDHDGLFIYRYSPLVAALLVPLGVLPPLAGAVCWRLLNLAVYLGGLTAWARAAFPRDPGWSRRAQLLLLAAPLSASGLIDGQANPLVIGLMLLAAVAAERDRPSCAAVCVALPCLVKLYPIAFGLLLVLVYPRLAWRCLLALGVGLATPFLLQDPAYVADQYRGWAHLLSLDRGRQDWPLELSYRDLRLLCRVWLVPLGPTPYLAVQLVSAAALAALLLAGRRAGWSRRRLGALAVGLGSCWMLLLGPATEGCTYVLLAPTLALALVPARAWKKLFALRAGLLASFWLLVVASAAVWFPGGKHLHEFGPHPLAALLVLVCLLAGTGRALASRRPEAVEALPLLVAA
jgi:hypothetical protein